MSQKKNTPPKKKAAPGIEAESRGRKVDVHYLTRVEGHGNIVAEIDGRGQVRACRWEVPEAPRFFEAMLLGKSFRDAHQITSRICGICSIGHQLCSLQATEEAMGIRVSGQTLKLRKLALHAENLQSHLLHVAYLVLPDLAGVGSVLPLAKTHRKELLGFIALHRYANEFSRLVTGRTTHPQRMVPGGFNKLPTEEDLENLLAMTEEAMDGLEAGAEFLASLSGAIPEFSRETEYVALTSPGQYAMYWGQISTSRDLSRPSSHYLDVTNEYMVPQSTAKWTRNKGESLMVGALARYNINHAHLTPRAKAAASVLGLSGPCFNSYMNSFAQVVECMHSMEDSANMVRELLDQGLRREPAPEITPRAGRGVGAVEVPRSILFHSYEYDAKGRMVEADCVIPTNQNHGNIQKDLEALVPMFKGDSEAEIELKLSMLVRAYDPCISCSTHYVTMDGPLPSLVRFKRV